MFTRILLILISLCVTVGIVSAADTDPSALNVRTTSIRSIEDNNQPLKAFITDDLRPFFFTAPGDFGKDGVLGTFTNIAFQIKNFFIAIAVIFLIIGVIKLLFSSSDEESVKKWRSSIIWVSVGIFVMQIAFSVWSTLILDSAADTIGSGLGWQFWTQVFSPIVGLLQMLAAFGFLAMAVWAFYILVTAAGDEERIKKAKNTVIYAIIGFLLIKIPEALVKAIYGDYQGCTSLTTSGCISGVKVNVDEGIGIVAKLFSFFNTFLSVICVILIIYAGWLVLISGGEEEKLKKAKRTILYIIIGFVVLVASHSIFRFFIVPG